MPPGLDEDRARLYVDLVWQALPTAARLILEAHMNTNWEPQNPIFRRLKAEGREEGREVGQQIGRAEGEREMVRRLLEIRFGALTDEHLTRLQEATEPQLMRWAERVLSAPDLAAVFSAE